MKVAKASFPNPFPALGDVTSANAALRVAINEAADGSREKSAIKRARLAELTSLVRQLANYVTATCNGNMVMMLASGFPTRNRLRERIGRLRAPNTPKVKQGKVSGEINVSVPPIYGASSHNWRLALASTPSVYVQQAQTVGGRITFSGLTPGEVYNVQANAVGAAGTSNWSLTGSLRVI